MFIVFVHSCFNPVQSGWMDDFSLFTEALIKALENSVHCDVNSMHS